MNALRLVQKFEQRILHHLGDAQYSQSEVVLSMVHHLLDHLLLGLVVLYHWAEGSGVLVVLDLSGLVLHEVHGGVRQSVPGSGRKYELLLLSSQVLN